MKDRKPFTRRRTVAQPPRHHEVPRTQLPSLVKNPPFSRPIRAYPPRNPAVFALITASDNQADDSLIHTSLPDRRTASNNGRTRTRFANPVRSKGSDLSSYPEPAVRIAYTEILGAPGRRTRLTNSPEAPSAEQFLSAHAFSSILIVAVVSLATTGGDTGFNQRPSPPDRLCRILLKLTSLTNEGKTNAFQAHG